MDNGIKLVPPMGGAPAVAPAINPKRLPPPVVVDNGRPLAPKSEHAPVSNLHKQEVATEVATTTEEAPKVEPVVPPVDEAAKRQQRKEEWNMAERARQMEASANEKLKAAQAYETALANFDKDPLALAKILKMSVPELLDKMQRAAFSMPTEKVLTPEEKYQLKALEYEKTMQEVKQQQVMLNNQMIKDNHINKKILPELVKNPDKYELLHVDVGVDAAASFIFDYIAQQYNETGKELNPSDVCQAFEEELEETYRGNAEKLRNVKKFKDLFAAKQAEVAAAEEAVEAGEEAAKTVPAPKLDTSVGETDLAKLVTPRGTKPAKAEKDNTISKAKTREQRLAEMAAKRAAQ